jgi:hypothetical protein
MDPPQAGTLTYVGRPAHPANAFRLFMMAIMSGLILANFGAPCLHRIMRNRREDHATNVTSARNFTRSPGNCIRFSPHLNQGLVHLGCRRRCRFASTRALAKKPDDFIQLGAKPRYCQKYQVARGKIDR